MSDPFLGEIRIFAGDFAPADWAYCDGQLVAISQNQELAKLLGTTYGGDGYTTIGLPDLRGRVPVHQGQGPGLTYQLLGMNYGHEKLYLRENNIPSHTHQMVASKAIAIDNRPEGNVLAMTQNNFYDPLPSDSSLKKTFADNVVGNTGEAQAHPNMQPYIGLHFIIALKGDLPIKKLKE